MFRTDWIAPIKISYRFLMVSLAFIIFFSLLLFLPFEPDINKGLALLACVGFLWFSESIHITITALLIPILAIFLNILPTADALVSFSDPVIFLFLGGFALSAALRHQGLDEILAKYLTKIAKGNLAITLFLLFISSAFLSMWISNTATAAMMLPILLGLLKFVDKKDFNKVALFSLLGVAYSSSIGGIATLVGSPPNAIAAAELNMNFHDWMFLTFPLFLFLLPSMWLILYLLLRPNLKIKIKQNLDAPKVNFDYKKILTLVIFGFTVFSWIFSAPLSQILGGIAKFDTLVALVAVFLVVTTRCVTWRELEKNTEWGILLLFGGGLTLSAVLQTTKTSAFLASNLGNFLQDLPPFYIFLMIAFFVVMLTEVASNTASAALLVPLFASLGVELGIDPVLLVVLVGICASCAFMLPVATPPNAIMYSSGHIKLKDFIKVGFVLNIFCAIVIAFWSNL